MFNSHRLRLIWVRKWWLLLAALVGAGAAYGVSESLDPTYEADSVIAIVPSQQVVGTQLSTATLQQIAAGYVELARSSRVLEDARERGAGDVSASELRDDTDISTEPGGLIRLTVGARQPEAAAKRANAQTAALIAAIDRVEASERREAVQRIEERLDRLRADLDDAQPGGGEATAIVNEIQQLSIRAADARTRPTGSARLVESASPPSSPASPKPVRNAVFGALAAVLLGVGLIYLFFAASSRYETGEDAALDLELPLLAELPQAKPDDPDALDAFRSLRTNVSFAVERPGPKVRSADGRFKRKPADQTTPQVFLITSPDPGAGKTYVTSNLARAFARNGHRVAALDGDLRRPTLHEQFDIRREPGLSDHLVSPSEDGEPRERDIELSRAVEERGGVLNVMPAGRPTDDSTELLATEEMAAVLTDVRDRFEVALLDSPPALGVADATILSRYVSGVVVVVDARHTPRRQAQRAVQALRAVDAHIVGFVFNRVSADQSYYGYSYGYHAADASPEPSERS